jgi:alginate O-acetyltransferase complex protein AlgI
MLFNSFTFLAFFACVAAVHSLPLPWNVRKFNLVLASYLFYAAWSPWFTLLLLFATITNGLAAKLLAVWDACPSRRRVVLWTAVALNIGLLSAFKYGNEFLALWRWGAQYFAPSNEALATQVLLPVGLSFFTFQALSYTIDVYRRTIPPARNPIDLALFVSFFPVLLAGPLLRAGPFFAQCAKPLRATGDQFASGAALFTLGVFMKVALADQVFAPVVRQVYAPHIDPDTLSSWVGTLAFAGQDYCDFAGYSTCAMGIGLCLGFILPENFRAPFASVGFRDLWQRWHITLVAWMRDYVFNSLGGVYKGYRRAAINVTIVMVLIGLWHGAAWTYIIFGLLHAMYLISEAILQRLRIRRWRLWSTAPGTFLLWLATMLLCCIAFVFYRAETLDKSWHVLCAMSGWDESATFRLAEHDLLATTFVIEAIIVIHWMRRSLSLEQVLARAPWIVTAICLALMLFAITVSSGQSQDFLYFHY